MYRAHRAFIVALAVLAVSVPSAAWPEYCATGPIRGNICSGFVIESCSFVRVDAVEGDNGQLYTVRDCYESVSEYKEGDGRCWIRTKSSGAGLWSWMTNAAVQPKFFHKNDRGEYEELDVEYLVFECVKR